MLFVLIYSILWNFEIFSYDFLIKSYAKEINDFDFAVAGDWSCQDNTKKTVSNLLNKNPDLVISLGDNSYYETADCWLDIMDPLDEKLKTAIGNHDHSYYDKDGIPEHKDSLLEQYMDHFNLDNQYYSFNKENIHFLIMSTEEPYVSDSDQYNFVEDDLKKSFLNKSIDWIIVAYHRLAYTGSTELQSLEDLRDTYHPLFEKYDVDLVLQAHAHNYQRSFPIKYNLTDSLDPIITSKNESNYFDPEGQIFLVVGTGGAVEVHPFLLSQKEFIAIAFNAYGFLKLDLQENGSKLIGQFFDNSGVFSDRFILNKKNKSNDILVKLPTIYENQLQMDLVTNELQFPNMTSIGKKDKPDALLPKLNSVYENQLQMDLVTNELQFPTNMAFLGKNDILVTEKQNGMIKRIIDGKIVNQPILDVNVANTVERGMLGIDILQKAKSTDVFLFYTESIADGNDFCPETNVCDQNISPLGNRIYKYKLSNDGLLIDSQLLLDLPATPGPEHNGGNILFGPDNYLYVTIRDLRGPKTTAINYEGGLKPNLTGGILRIHDDGTQPVVGPLGTEFPLNMYYAYGIRNSYGMDFDPLTGNLWDTENGPEFGDEVNLVLPGFNSGWKDIQGTWLHKNGKPVGNINSLTPKEGLVDFDGKGKYRNPEFTWFYPVGVTALKFLNSDLYGTDLQNDIFVGDVNNGNIYHFELNENRTELILDNKLCDKIADTNEELSEITFASGFEGITDLELSPDGYLYILSYRDGSLYKLTPKKFSIYGQ